MQASPARILVVDDESDTCESLRRLLEIQGYAAVPETSARRALEKIGAADFDLLLTDVGMSELDGLELCRHVLKKRPGLPIIVMTGQANMQTAIAALRLGARDFLTKPLDSDELVSSVARALGHKPVAKPDASASEAAAPPLPELELMGSAGESEPMRHLYEFIASLSASVATVIIHGETGTGKEVIARTIHANSPQRHGPFVALSCAAIPAGLLESELFGHVRGAFTGAGNASPGLLVQANGGTLLLDEIGELPAAMQPKLLRALQERTLRPLGGKHEVEFDCRIIAATNRDLEVEVSKQRFREDLYYRLDVIRLTVPPLRDRGDDILLLARFFLKRLAKGKPPPALAASTAQALLSYEWPGNVRELENCMERAVTLCQSEVLGVEDLPERIRLAGSRPADGAAVEPLHVLERRHILAAVASLDGNKTLAAERLGIDRSTLYRRLEQYESDAPTDAPS